MNDKSILIKKYGELRKLNIEKKPLKKEFLKYSNISELELTKVFGKDAYSKLQIECGDTPNKLKMERTPLKKILEQYGQLVRKHKRIPVTSDWIEADFYPRLDGLRKVHNLNWPDMVPTFLENYSDKLEWKDVVNILQQESIPSSMKLDKKYKEIIDKLNTWLPDRKRVIEEGYKIELRNYLNKFFDVDEEVGESNPDLLINGRYPIEIKKDPTQSEYDRLLGQMIRHNKSFGNAIAIVTNISSRDRFKKFQKLFTEIHNKLNMNAELLNK